MCYVTRVSTQIINKYKQTTPTLISTQLNPSCLGSFEGSSRPARHNLLEEVSDLQPNDRLKQPRPIVAPREIRVLQHLLRHFSIELGRKVAQMALHIDQLIQSVKLPIHFQYRNLQDLTET